jgi:UDP:flavonoid glycosyltransferase YjiC (YdhE family)
MKVLIASTPPTGHINPMFALGHILIREGHEVVGLSANVMRKRIESVGAMFRALPPGADLDFTDVDATLPELKLIPPGPDNMRFAFERGIIDPLPAQYEGIRQVLEDFPADVILADNLFLGILPMLLRPKAKRPPIALVGTSFLHWRRDDGAPHFAGLPPASNDAQRQNYVTMAQEIAPLFTDPVARYLNDCLARIGVGPLSMDLLDAMIALPDTYLQLTVPSFEFPSVDTPASVQFIGALPIIPEQAPLPPWADELDGSRKVVLVTQGTVSNHNFGQLIAPTLQALKNERDVLVVATAGGRSVDQIPGPVPGNARLASYLPFEWLLPKVDALVTNGGYGTVNQALSFGIPLVTAGMTEDKADVGARVAWSEVGINLATDEPTSQALFDSIRSVLDKPNYRTQALSMAKEFGKIGTRSKFLQILEQLVHAGV